MDSTSFSFSFNSSQATPRAVDPRRTEILTAIIKNNVEALKALLVGYTEINLLDNNENTPLLVAAQTPYSHIIDLLIEHGANQNIRNSFDGTPLTMAMSYKCISVINALIRAGAEVNLKNTLFRVNILKNAVKIADPEIICTIIKAGALVDYPFFLKMQKKAFKQPEIFQPVVELLLTNELIAAKANSAKNRVTKLYANELNPSNIQFGPLEKDLYTQQLQWIAKFVLRSSSNCHFFEKNDEIFVKVKHLKINLSQLFTQADLSHIALSQKDNLLFIKLCQLSTSDIDKFSTYLPPTFTLPKKSLTPAERFAIHCYSEEDHTSMNSILHKNPPEGEKDKPDFYRNTFLKTLFLASGLNKITPSWTRDPEDLTLGTITYRGEEHIHPDEINQRIQKLQHNISGMIQKQAGFSSTSTNLDISRKFEGKLCRIQYDEMYGKNIQPLSTHKNEEEYLQLPGFIQILSHDQDNETHVFKAKCITPLFTKHRSVQHEHEFSILKTFASSTAIPNDAPEKTLPLLFLEGLLTECQFVYNHYLSKGYTDNSCSDDWEHKTFFSQILPRPNHNIAHVMRVAHLVSVIAPYLTFEFSQREINIVQLTALFSVVGRQNEMGFKDMKSDNMGYKLFKQDSAQQFANYVNQTQFLNMTAEEIKLHAHNIMKMGEPGEEHPSAVLLALAHKLDLLRCYEPDRVKNDIILPLTKYLSNSDDVIKLLHYAESLLHATGNRVMYGEEISEYNDELFYAVSTNVETCFKAINSVLAPIPTPNIIQIPNVVQNPFTPLLKRKAESEIDKRQQPELKKIHMNKDDKTTQEENKKNNQSNDSKSCG